MFLGSNPSKPLAGDDGAGPSDLTGPSGHHVAANPDILDTLIMTEPFDMANVGGSLPLPSCDSTPPLHRTSVAVPKDTEMVDGQDAEMADAGGDEVLQPDDEHQNPEADGAEAGDSKVVEEEGEAEEAEVDPAVPPGQENPAVSPIKDTVAKKHVHQ